MLLEKCVKRFEKRDKKRIMREKRGHEWEIHKCKKKNEMKRKGNSDGYLQ
jgi:hypothetical protein